MLYLSSHLQLKHRFKDKLSAHSFFLHLLKHSVKFTIMKAQNLPDVAIIIFSSLFFFVCGSHVCVLCMSVCSLVRRNMKLG